MTTFKKIGFSSGVANKGKKRSEEFKEKIRAAHRNGLLKPSFAALVEAARNKRDNPEWLRRLSDSKKGSKSKWWRGGVSKLNLRIRNLPQNKRWRFAIYKKGKGKCALCGSKKKLNADHIKPFALILKENKIKSTKEAIKCKELWDVKNGRVLCLRCHQKTPTFGNSRFLATPTVDNN